MQNSVRSFILFSLFLIIARGASAQDTVHTDTHLEYNSRKVSINLGGLSDNMFGESIDIDTGAVSFMQTDVSLPGNSQLDVSFGRSRSAGHPNRFTYVSGQLLEDWSPNVPYISAMVENTWRANRCSAAAYSGAFYWQGIKLNIPGQSPGALVKPRLTTHLGAPVPKLVSENYWKIHCISGASDGAEGFEAISPSGVKYTFKSLIYYKNRTIRMGTDTSGTYRETTRAVLYATRAEDVYGNYVNYTYNHVGPTKIEGNDNRTIDILYTGNRISSVTANNKTWQYAYIGKKLTGIILPDGREWAFDFKDTGLYACFAGSGHANLTHPNGTNGYFALGRVRNGRTGMYAIIPSGMNGEQSTYDLIMRRCDNGDGYEPNSLTQRVMYSVGVMSKTIVLAGGESYTWDYEYEEDYGSYGHHGLNSAKKRRIIFPDGKKVTTHVYRNFDSYEGKIDLIETHNADGTLMQSESFTYKNGLLRGDPLTGIMYSLPQKQEILLEKKVITRGADTFTTEYAYNITPSSPGYSFGKPTQTKSYSSAAGSTAPRIIDTVYEHNKSKWILGLPKTVTRNGREVSGYSYDGFGQVMTQTRYGSLHQAFTYNSDGTLRTAANAMGETYTATNYKAGIPQHVKRPDNTIFTETIDDNGRTTSQTDSRGNTTSYEYDVMGRLTKIVPPARAGGGIWAPTDITYDFTGPGVTQTIEKHNAKTIVNYDSMLRPVLEESIDLTTNQSIFTRKEYDGLGRTTFTSVPSFNALAIDGTHTEYDALGRVTSTEENYGANVKTRHEYKPGNQHWFYDGENKRTITARYGYDGPGQGDLYYITDPNGSRTYTYRNVHGEAYLLRQRGPNADGSISDHRRYMYYNSERRLCRMRGEEGGDTLYSYDAAGRLRFSQKGAPTGYGCRAPSGPDKVIYRYDPVGRLLTTGFYDIAPGETRSTTPPIRRIYDADGNMIVSNRSRSPGRPGVHRAYDYNELGLVTSEIMIIDGLIYTVGYEYDAAGNVTNQTLPSGREITYTPDGLGRTAGLSAQINGASQTLASGINYFAGGAMQSMTYGNGLNFTQTLNARFLPARVTVGGASSTVQDLSYTYDKRAKVKTITDAVNASQNRSFTYDHGGRLIGAVGPWGTGSYGYDALGNLLTKSLGARTVTNIYDTTKNRVTRSEDTGPKGNRDIGYDARGNVTSLGTLQMIYDNTDQPTRVAGTVDGVATVGDYVYDGNLKRARSNINGQLIYNVYDLSGKLVHVDIHPDAAGAGGSRTDYIPGFARIKTDDGDADEISYMHDDHLGSASTVTGADGTLAWRESYTPYGETLLSPAANDNQGGFTGHIKDKATGLNYMQARYYDPNMGRFLSVDPVTFMDTGNPGYFNRYTYTMNDPVNRIDPDGQACVPCVVVAAVIIADKVYGAYDAVQTVKGVADGTIDPADAITSQATSQAAGLIAGPAGRFVAKKAPNPFGKKGGPKHQQKTQDVVDDIESRGLAAETELKINTPDGEKNHRFVDAVGRDPNTGEVVEMHQVGRTNPSRGDPVARERRAMDDIECATGCRPEFHDYNEPG